MTRSEDLYQKLHTRLLAMNPGDRFCPVRFIMEHYGVSQATVSKALQRLQQEGVLQKGEGRALEVTSEVLRFRSGAKPVYCLAQPNWQSDYYHWLEYHFRQLAEEMNFDLKLHHYDWHSHLPEQLPAGKIDGIFIIPGGDALTSEDIRRLEQFPLPALLVGSRINGVTVNNVGIDNEYTGAMAAHHFIDGGHRSLAVVVSQPKNEAIMNRIKGFRQFCELHDVHCETIDCGIRSGDFSPAKVYQTLAERFRRKPDFTALFTLCEDSAAAIYRICAERHIRIPEDLSVIATGQS